MEQTRKRRVEHWTKIRLSSSIAFSMWTICSASGRISPEMTVSVLSTVAANATNETVRLDALRMMPQLLAKKLSARTQAPPGAGHFEPDSKRDGSRSS